MNRRILIECGEPLTGKEDIFKKDIIVYGEPVGKKNNYLAGLSKQKRPYIYKSKKLTDYEKYFVAECLKCYKGRMGINTQFDIIVEVYYRNLKNDLDNSVTTVMDCLQMAGIITDDALCRHATTWKIYDPHRPRVEVKIMADDPQPSIFPDL